MFENSAGENVHCCKLAVDMKFYIHDPYPYLQIFRGYPWIYPYLHPVYMYPLNIHKAQMVSTILNIAISISISHLVSK